MVNQTPIPRRLEFQGILETILGGPDVYFQPPENIEMNYPCIVYARDNASSKHADDNVYHYTQRYQVTYIDHSPDSDVIQKLAELPLCLFNRHFATSGLNHDVFVIYH